MIVNVDVATKAYKIEKIDLIAIKSKQLILNKK